MQVNLLADIQTTVAKSTDRKKQQMYKKIQNIFSDRNPAHTEAVSNDCNNIQSFLNQQIQKELNHSVLPPTDLPTARSHTSGDGESYLQIIRPHPTNTAVNTAIVEDINQRA